MTRVRYINLAVVSFLLLVAGSLHGAVFGDPSGYVAAAGGVLLGCGVGFASAKFKWGGIATVLATLLVYLLLGGAFALPERNLFFVVPTVETLQLLVMQAVFGWVDVLTVSPPLHAFAGPTVLPLVSGLLCSVVAVVIAVRASRRQAFALVPVGVFGAVGILWGSYLVPTALAVAALGAVVAVLWVAWLAASRRRQSTEGILQDGTHAAGARQWQAVVSVVVAALLGVGLAVFLPVGQRNVLRDHIEPPLEVNEYASPLTYFRNYVSNQKDDTLFTLDQLPSGYRIRLATMDAYDGVVYRISEPVAGQGFRRIGEVTTDQPIPSEGVLKLAVSVDSYAGNWVPGGGDVRALTFASERADSLSESLYYSDSLGTLFEKVPLTTGDAYEATLVPAEAWTDAQLESQSFAQVDVPKATNVPDIIGAKATELTAGVDKPIEQVRAIEQYLHTEGFFSNGSDNLSRAGHRTERIRLLLEQPQMIGDDEQYAVAMALMLNQLNIPARVVMGFYPKPEDETSGAVAITGDDTHAWVEVAFSQAGWVPFDPTPPRDKKPQTQVPKPKTKPKPQVLQPPPPPMEPAELPPEYLQDDNQADDDLMPGWLAVLLVVLGYLGVTGLVLSPFLAIIAAKAVRRRRRQRRGSAIDQTMGAWAEVVDQATDLRRPLPTRATRYEQALAIDAGAWGKPADYLDLAFRPAAPGSAAGLASAVDGVAFSALDHQIDPTPAWAAAGALTKEIKASVTRRRRLLGAISLRSLWRRPQWLAPVLAKLTRTKEAR